jgi:hypothetical protein
MALPPTPMGICIFRPETPEQALTMAFTMFKRAWSMSTRSSQISAYSRQRTKIFWTMSMATLDQEACSSCQPSPARFRIWR